MPQCKVGSGLIYIKMPMPTIMPPQIVRNSRTGTSLHACFRHDLLLAVAMAPRSLPTAIAAILAAL